jgi:hypothetical protein
MIKNIINNPFGIPLSKYKICKVGSNHYIVIGGSNKFLYTDNKMIKWHLGRTDNTLTNHTLTSVNDGCVVIGGIKNQFNISNEIAAIKFLDNGIPNGSLIICFIVIIEYRKRAGALPTSPL